MKKILLIALLLTGLRLQAQPGFQFSNYLYSPFILNPAATGVDGASKLMVAYRQQWLGFTDAPRVMLASFETHLPGNNGVGAWVSSQKNGAIVDNNLSLSFANKVHFSYHHYLALGVAFGLNNRSLDLSSSDVQVSTDPALYNNTLRNFQFNVAAGLYYVNHKFKAGLSAPSLYGSRENKVFVSTSAFTSYDFHVNKEFIVTPNLLLRTFNGNPTQLDISVAAWWRDMLFSQLMYRTSGNVVAGVGFKAEHFFINYFLEVSNGKLSNIGLTTHEFMLGYALGKHKHKKVE